MHVWYCAINTVLLRKITLRKVQRTYSNSPSLKGSLDFWKIIEEGGGAQTFFEKMKR